jgi:hypothetical protein
MFNARSSAQPSSLIGGSPASTFIDSASKGLGGLADSFVKGRSMSQSEARSLAGLLPFSTMMPMANGLSYMIQDLPARSPAERRHQQ